MKKLLSLVLSVVLIMTMSLSAFAYTPVLNDNGENVATNTRIYNSITNGKNTNSTYYYYDSETGEISSSASNAETELGDLIKFEDSVPEYEFTYKHSNGTTYHYSVLDEIVGADGKKQYFIYSNDSFNKIKNLAPNTTHNNFNMADKAGVGYFLNNDFYNGTHTLSGVPQFDSVIKDYVEEHEYLIEGTYVSLGEDLSDYAYQSYDYTETMKISLLSISEYVKYHKRIGKGIYHNAGTFATNWGSFILMRTPINYTSDSVDGTAGLFAYYLANGDVSRIGNIFTNNEYFVRPCFYVSEDYFKEVELTSAGTEVEKIVNNLTMPNGIYTISENGDNGQLSPSWTNNGGTFVNDEGRIVIPADKSIVRNLKAPINENKGILTVETDIIQLSNKGTYIGIVQGGSSKPVAFFMMPSSQGDHKRVKYYNTNNNFDGSYIGLSGVDSNAQAFVTPAKAKLSIDLSTGIAYIRLEFTDGFWNAGVYYARTRIDKPIEYLNSLASNPITGITFNAVTWGLGTDSSVIDNIKITYDPTGCVIDNITQLSPVTLKLDFKDYADISAVTASDIIVTDSEVVNISKVGNSIYATLKDAIVNTNKNVELGGYFAIVNNVKRNDVLQDTYIVTGNSASFTYDPAMTSAPYAALTSEKFATGEIVKAYASIPNASGEDGTVSLILAAYSGRKLIGVSVEELDVTADAETAVATEASLVLEGDADTIKVFLWDGQLAPIAHEVATK